MERPHPGLQGVAQGIELRGTDGGGEQERHPELGERQLSGQPPQLVLLELLSGEPEPAGPVEGGDQLRIEDNPGCFGRRSGRRGQTRPGAGSTR